MKFQGKTIWITGASSGIGEALAYAFSAEGAQLILSARREAVLRKVQQNCAYPDKIWIAPLDLTKEEEIEGIVENVLKQVAKVDILVNNGGISQRSLVLETDMEVYRRLMEVNYFGTVALSKALLAHFVAQKSGHIVTISSLMGKFAAPLRSGYAAAKHALHGFFDGLRAEYHDDGIKVMMVCPGYISTDISKNALSGGGGKHGALDSKTAEGLTADQCAAKILRGILRNKQEIYIGKKEILGIYVKRFFPSLINRIVRKVKVV